MAKEARAPWHASAVLAGAFLATALVVFHPLGSGLVLGSRTADPPMAEPLPPGHPWLLDVGAVLHPFLSLTWAEVRAGRVPLWNPFAGAGAPFLANQQSAVLHPFTWLALAFPWRAGLTVLALLRFGLALAGTWLLARDLGQPKGAAALAAASFSTGGGIVVWLLYPVGAVLAHVPLLLYLARRVARGEPAAGWLGAALASSVLAGHLEYLPLIWTAVAGIAWRRRAGLRAQAPLLGAFAAAVAATAVFLLPSVEYLAQSPVLFARRHRQARLHDPSPLLCALVDPQPFGTPPWPELKPLGYFPQTVAGGYVGSAVLVLAAVGAAARPRLAAAIVAALLVLLPRPIGSLIWNLPVLSWMQPDKLWTMLGLLVSLLAGQGAAAVVAGKTRAGAAVAGLAITGGLLAWEQRLYTSSATAARFWILVPAAVAVASAAASRTRLRQASVPILFLALLGERTAGIGRWNPWEPPAKLYADLPVLERLRARIGHDRIVAFGGILAPDLATAYRLRDTRLYDAISLDRSLKQLPAWARQAFGLRLHGAASLDRRAGATIHLLAPGARGGAPLPELAGALGVELPPAPAEARQPFRASPGWMTSLALHLRADPAGDGGLVVELRAPGRSSPLLFRQILKRRWLPESAGWKLLPVHPPVETAPNEALEISISANGSGARSRVFLSTTPHQRGAPLRLGELGGRRLAFAASWNEVAAQDVLDTGDGVDVVQDRLALPRARLRSSPEDRTPVRFLRDDPTHVALQVDAVAPDVLELGDTFYSGWRADVDGVTVPIDADGAIRAVRVPAGTHEIHMRYVPASYAHGLFVSCTALLTVALAIVSRRGASGTQGSSPMAL